MKRFLNKWTMLVVLLIGMGGSMAARAQGAVSFQVFYDELQPYGTWMSYGSYGYVWIPQVERDFTPYGTNGYWVNTEYGNTWVSDYAWGWAPFHYGRWLYDDFYGWIWVPGNEWAPAWVAWRNGGGYYGWAPLMPGMGISVTVGIYDRIPHHCWNFVPYQYITYHRVYAHCVPRPTVVNIIHQTTIVTYNHHHDRRYAYFTGPSRREMERNGRTRVEHYRVDSRQAPGRSEVGRGRVAIYRPHVAENTRRSAAPTRVVPEHDMRRRQETALSQRDRNPEMRNPDLQRSRDRDMREGEQRLDRPRSETPHRDAEALRRQQQENNVREQNNMREQQDRQQRDRLQEQDRSQQQDRLREQQQLQDRRQQENNLREQRRQQERVQQDRMQDQQRSQQQQDRLREQQQLQERRQQENNMREQQRQQQDRLQQVRMQEQQQRNQQQDQMRNQQQQMRQQQQQQQQLQNRQRMEQQPSQNIRRERTPSPERHDNGGGSQRRRH